MAASLSSEIETKEGKKQHSSVNCSRRRVAEERYRTRASDLTDDGARIAGGCSRATTNKRILQWIRYGLTAFRMGSGQCLLNGTCVFFRAQRAIKCALVVPAKRTKEDKAADETGGRMKRAAKRRGEEHPNKRAWQPSTQQQAELGNPTLTASRLGRETHQFVFRATRPPLSRSVSLSFSLSTEQFPQYPVFAAHLQRGNRVHVVSPGARASPAKHSPAINCYLP